MPGMYKSRGMGTRPNGKKKAPAKGGMAKRKTMAKGPARMPSMVNRKPGKRMR